MPRLPGLRQAPISLGRRASAEDFGAAQGRQLEQQGAQVVQASETARQLFEADQGSRVARAISGGATRFDELRRQIAQSPDYTEHEKQFEEGRKAILEELGGGIAEGRFRQEFEDRIGTVALRYRNDVRDSARRAQVDSILANLDLAGTESSNLAARSGVASGERAEIAEQYALSVRQAVAAGALTRQAAVDRLGKFERSISEADRRLMIQEDPAAAYLEMKDPESPLVRGLTEAERLQAMDRAIDAHGQRISERRAAIAFQQRQQDRVESQAAEAAERDADDLLQNGDLQGLQEHLARTRNILDPAKRRFYLKRLAAGGGFEDPGQQSNPQSYIEFSSLAGRGELELQTLNRALSESVITQTDYNQLQKLNADRRFGDARRFLEGALEVGERAVGDDRFIAQARSEEALRSFTDWQLSHQSATREESFEKARTLVNSAALVDLRRLESAQLMPTYIVRDRGLRADLTATTAKTLEAFESGQIDRQELTEELRRIERIEDIQTKREAAQAQKEASQ